MKLGTLAVDGIHKVVAITPDGAYVDLHAADSNIPPSLKQILADSEGLSRVAATMVKAMTAGPFIAGPLLAPIPDPGKVICIGLNYRDHALETRSPIPDEPVCFSKFTQAVVGPDANIVLPAVSTQVDYEAELVVVIGKAGKNIPKEKAWDHVAGYTCGNDVSARDWQKGRPGGQWLLGKTPDTFAPTGPYFVTADEVGTPHELRVQLRLNGITMQDSSTKEFIFGVDAIIAHLSQLITLQPGDLIFTGTPPGVGMARTPQVFLKNGDVVEIEIEDVGVLRNMVVEEKV